MNESGMVEVEVLVDDFCIGLTNYAKGTKFKTSILAANYMVDKDTCKIVQPAKKKRTYKRRDMQAE